MRNLFVAGLGVLVLLFVLFSTANRAACGAQAVGHTPRTGWFAGSGDTTALAFVAEHVTFNSGFPAVIRVCEKNTGRFASPPYPTYIRDLHRMLDGPTDFAVVGPDGERLGLTQFGKICAVARLPLIPMTINIPDISNDAWGDPSLGIKPGQVYPNPRRLPISALFDMTMPGKYRIKILLPHPPKKTSERYLTVT
ncbi:MAG: hypothetical protein ACP5O7_03745, partial [Phycisphaerae bacterium]